jgi:hypothetical protein
VEEEGIVEQTRRHRLIWRRRRKARCHLHHPFLVREAWLGSKAIGSPTFDCSKHVRYLWLSIGPSPVTNPSPPAARHDTPNALLWLALWREYWQFSPRPLCAQRTAVLGVSFVIGISLPQSSTGLSPASEARPNSNLSSVQHQTPPKKNSSMFSFRVA